MQTNIHFLLHLAQFFLEWEMFQTQLIEQIKTQFYIQYIYIYIYVFIFNYLQPLSAERQLETVHGEGKNRDS
jgi:hypothetical protein